MSTLADRSLQAVPHTNDQKARFASALLLKERTGRVLDRMLAAPRKAARYAGQLAEVLHVQGVVRRLQELGRNGLGLAAGLVRRVGVLPAATALITSPLGQRWSSLALRETAAGLSWAGRKAVDLGRRGLRLLGKPGERLDQRLGAAGEALRAWVQRRTRDARAVTGVVDPRLTLRVVHSLAMSVVLHRLLNGLVANRGVRVLIEALLVPAVLDWRVLNRARHVERTPAPATARVTEPVVERKQPPSVLVEPAVTPAGSPEAVSPSTEAVSGPEVGEQSKTVELDVADVQVGAEDLDPELVDPPQPSNRAQRRVHQQSQARARRHAGRR